MHISEMDKNSSLPSNMKHPAPNVINIFYQDTTTNQSFMDLHHILKSKGIKNNKYFLAIYDPALMGVDPYDSYLSMDMKARILRECMINFWYFVREVIRIPIEGGSSRYTLHRGNLAMNYLFVFNFDMFVDLPRQHFKTISALVRYVWVYNFGTKNTQMMFINKKHDDSKENLRKMKNIINALPEFLRMNEAYDSKGKKLKSPNTVVTMQHPINLNIIKTLPAARTPALADGAGRGLTMAIVYGDEWAFTGHNRIMYMAAAPALSRAKLNAQKNGSPYGILLTTTPGDLTTDEGTFANEMRLNATMWEDRMYDLSYQELLALRDANTRSPFFYIKYTYRQLGSGEDYFQQMVKDLLNDWNKIRREVLQEWSIGSMNCPFSSNDLETIKSMCRTEPVNSIYFGKANQFKLNIWSELPLYSLYPPIIGVDVAGSWQNDSSAITIIDSLTTKVIATLNCNFITSHEIAKIVHTLVKEYMPNAIVNVERNGGYGASVLQLLCKSDIKANLYYEIKEQVKEERYDGKTINKRKIKVKSYGTDNTKDNRIKLIEKLFERVEYHKDKFIAPILYDELSTMEMKKNGRIEHASGSHDDQIFSYLMALYVWYFGEDIMSRYNISRREISTDGELDETIFDLEERYGNLERFNFEILEDTTELIQDQLKILESGKTISQAEFEILQYQEDKKALDKLLNNPVSREAVARAKNLDLDHLNDFYGGNGGMVNIENDLYDLMYGKPKSNDNIEGNLANAFRNILNK